MGSLGHAVDCAGLRSLPLEGPHVLWLVVEGAMDLFAVDAAADGQWHFLGRLEPGTLLMGPVEGPQYTLVSRPLDGCAVRRIPLRELFAPAQPYAMDDTYGGQGAQGWYQDPYGQGYGTGDVGWAYGGGVPQLSALEQAFAQGVGRGLRVLFEARVDGRPAAGGASPDDDIQWMPVDPGTVRYGAEFGAEADGQLLIDGGMWQRMVNQQSRLLIALGRWIERLERDHEERAAAGIKAGEAAGDRAQQALLASIAGAAPDDRGEGGGDAVLAACRLVGAAAGIEVREPAGGADAAAAPGEAAAPGRTSPVERIALASGFRTREVALGDRWWRQDAGPLLGARAASGAPVALLWRRGGYQAVEPRGGRRTRIDASNAAGFAPAGVMFYRTLPEEPVSTRQLLRFGMRGSGPDVGRLLTGSLIAVGLGALVPIATGRILGSYVPQAEKGLIVQTALAIVATTLVSAAFMLVQNTAILRLEGRIEAGLQPAVWDRLLRLPTRFFAQRSTGELAAAAMGVSGIRRMLSGTTAVAVQSGTVAVVNLVLLVWYSVPLAFAALGMLAVVASVFLATGLWQLRWQRRLVELNNKLANRSFQTLRGLPKLRVAAAENFAYAAWATEFARSRELQQRVGRIRNVTTVFNAVYLPFCTLLLFMLLAGPARGSLSPSSFLTFSSAATMMLTSATQLTGALVSAVSVLPMVEQLRPVLEAAPEVPAASAQPGTLSGAIEVRGLSFRYSDDGPLVLDDVSFQVRPGEFVAVVGASGCGKSTLLRLLIGFDRPVAGGVLYDGQDLAALDQAAVRRQCGVVLQNAQPFTGSILECICGAESYTLEEAWQAAAMAGLAEDIKAMPMGMHTVLADGGGAVSGGQRQRLMIAQALIRRPRILFLDEATSALDNGTQRTVIDSTRAMRTTRIVIAHRLSTIMDADRVLVMAEGRVVQQGAPTELLAGQGGLFHELVRRQLR
ncbi:NHLP bacteriocin export ABC transporter permease/ATPase subunit [Streptomyces sp. PLK6-54]|uniref:NHLP bacteriocin export ABC transporter permease/ATPase subunit n=2 Tax=Actinacidiphila acidipaludis TaxID=2873382 RepID=A0ABS7PZS1_9ACTN|nr:NHLP bacteriocin export ABC transporter permease/ATPase subunit [Streptomyces acidipaludis]MBY8876383.1 NHLP bacteriocin export ABC transporter permease/ATPase subunit [Streptomyces acidipaludis]